MPSLKDLLMGTATKKAAEELAPPTQPSPSDDAYNREIRATHMKRGMGNITEQQWKDQIKAINDKYGK